MSEADDDDCGVAAEEVDKHPGWVPVAAALAQSLFTVTQLRALVGAGIIGTKKTKQGMLYSVADLARFEGMPRTEEPDEPSPVLAELRAISDGWKALLDSSLRATKQAQDHERMLVAAFAKPLETIGDSSKSLVSAVLQQNVQLVERANAGDKAKLDFVQAAEGMLKDQRAEMREQLEHDRKHELRLEMWTGVKKAAPHLLEGLKQTMGTDRLEAAKQLKEKLDIAKVAGLVHFLNAEEKELLCKAFGYDLAELERLNAEATEAEAAEAVKPEAAE